MKALNYGAGLALAAYLVLALAACSKTDNGSNNNSTAVAATQCTLSYDGTYRNQLNQPCSNASSCLGYTYNAQTGTYINPTTGQQIPAAQCGGTTTIPGSGYYGNNYVSGCQGWSQYYGVTYVPVDTGGGNLICVNFQYLQQQMVVQYPQFQYSPYYDASYWYSQPPMAYGYNYGYGYGQPYGGYSYGCGTGISLGVSTGGFSGGVSLCF